MIAESDKFNKKVESQFSVHTSQKSMQNGRGFVLPEYINVFNK